MASTFPERLRIALKDAHMTQKKLAESAEITEAAVSHYLAGDRIPRSSVVASIARALSCSVDELMGTGVEADELGFETLQRILARKSRQLTMEQKSRLAEALFRGEK